MKIAFVVNSIATEQPQYTTTRLAMTAGIMGHETWLIGLEDFAVESDGSLWGRARSTSGRHNSLEKFLDDLQGDDAKEERICVDELDIVVMRNDPADDATDRPWALTAGVAFGQLIAASGVLVVNDPDHLSRALNKAYFQHFPEIVRPRTRISRDPDAIADFVKEMGGKAVLKPLQGSGGSGVFLVSSDESPNLNQIVEAISRDGYVVVQEYLPEAAEGDVRMFVMNGAPLVRDGRHAAFRRVNNGADMRSNMHVGGEAVAVDVTDEMLHLVDLVRPKLVADGMFLVGVDIVGDKLMEVNVFSPGGLGSCEALYDINFTEPVIEALERKIEINGHYGGALGNTRLASI
jgi:glutathione synthase